VNNVQDNKSQQIQTVRQQIAYSGPIPDPASLAQYEKITPGLADRIVQMAEKEGEHRRHLEVFGQNANITLLQRRDREARVGQIFAFIISMTTIVTGGYVALNGHDVSGTFISLSGLCGIVTAFIYGRKSETSSDKTLDSRKEVS